MENFDKEHYKYLKETAKEEKVHVATREFEGLPYNGVSVAFALASEHPDCRMVRVSVSYCAPEDTYRKKVGKYNVLYKYFLDGEYIQLPIAQDVINSSKAAAELILDILTV
jgi:hypothetical protein